MSALQFDLSKYCYNKKVRITPCLLGHDTEKLKSDFHLPPQIILFASMKVL